MEELKEKLANKTLRVVGLRQVLKGLDKGEIGCVILAKDADSYFKRCVTESAKESGVKVIEVQSKVLLASYCNVEAPTGVAGLKC